MHIYGSDAVLYKSPQVNSVRNGESWGLAPAQQSLILDVVTRASRPSYSVAGTDCSFSRLCFWSIALHKCNFIFSSSKTSSAGSVWEGGSVPCSIVVTLEAGKEGLLQLQCLKKQVAL